MLVPVTVKFRGFAEVGERPEIETTLDPPAEIDEGLKTHVTPVLQDRTMEFCRSVLGPAAEIVN